MSLNDTPRSERVQISFFGKTNTGKSSLINALTNQNLAIVSDISGTTTDPVSKAMELLPLGAVIITDTAGYDDKSPLGGLRAEKTLQVLNKTDIAILVVNAKTELTQEDKNIIKLFEEKNIDYIITYNKCDLICPSKFRDKERERNLGVASLKSEQPCGADSAEEKATGLLPFLRGAAQGCDTRLDEDIPALSAENQIYVSAIKNININELKEKIASVGIKKREYKTLTGDLIKENDIILLVTPIDTAAPKGRLILPQQQVIRDILDNNGICIVTKETQLKQTLETIKNPKLVITDSQAFKYVNEILPSNIKLTSFSILFARYKGILKQAVEGVKNIENLENGDTILISEGCTHHRQCDDIGTVKLPKWIKNYTNKELYFEFSSGITFPQNLSKYKMIIHCGGCMLNEREVLNRYKSAKEQNIPISNYGITIAYLNGILERSIEIYYLNKD